MGRSGFESTMPRLFKAISVSRVRRFIGEYGLDLVTVVQRGASIGHDGFADVEAFKNFR